MTDLMWWCKQRRCVVGIISHDAMIQPCSEWSPSCFQQNLALTFTLAQLYSGCTGSGSLWASGPGKWTITAGMDTLSECNNKGWKRSHQLKWQPRFIYYVSCARPHTGTQANATSLVSTHPGWQVATLWPCVVSLNLLGQMEFTGHWHLF